MCLPVKIFGAKWEISVEIFHPLSGGQTLECSTSIRDEKNKLIYFPLPLSYHLHNTFNKSLLKATDIFSLFSLWQLQQNAKDLLQSLSLSGFRKVKRHTCVSLSEPLGLQKQFSQEESPLCTVSSKTNKESRVLVCLKLVLVIGSTLCVYLPLLPLVSWYGGILTLMAPSKTMEIRVLFLFMRFVPFVAPETNQ